MLFGGFVGNGNFQRIPFGKFASVSGAEPSYSIRTRSGIGSALRIAYAYVVNNTAMRSDPLASDTCSSLRLTPLQIMRDETIVDAQYEIPEPGEPSSSVRGAAVAWTRGPVDRHTGRWIIARHQSRRDGETALSER
jgi:hypothetical protein